MFVDKLTSVERANLVEGVLDAYRKSKLKKCGQVMETTSKQNFADKTQTDVIAKRKHFLESVLNSYISVTFNDSSTTYDYNVKNDYEILITDFRVEGNNDMVWRDEKATEYLQKWLKSKFGDKYTKALTKFENMLKQDELTQ